MILIEMVECDYCGSEINWEDGDDICGNVWDCEVFGCENHFCTKCFIDKFGVEAYNDMMHNSDLVYCPDCYAKIRDRE